MQFNVLAIDARQQVVALNLEAASEALAADQARAKGLSVISLSPAGFRFALPKPNKRFPVTLFTIELLSLLNAGLNLVEALQTLSEKDDNDVLREILAAINRGEPFSQAVAGLPRHFSGSRTVSGNRSWPSITSATDRVPTDRMTSVTALAGTPYRAISSCRTWIWRTGWPVICSTRTSAAPSIPLSTRSISAAFAVSTSKSSP